ncbi:MAG TPA: hypothetical protein PKC21_05260 [Oligoflexia bacterium]|nr:hypothetical protein [Oligoflexia bacterium]HMR24745.1 hypothetical protein [Oligoflexia bacterium]
MKYLQSFVFVYLIFITIVFAQSNNTASVRLETGIHSAYVWNGADLNHDDPVLTQALSIHFNKILKNISLSFWTSYGLNKDSVAGDDQSFTLDEFDTLLGYFIAWNQKISSYIELGWFYWTSNFFSNVGSNKHDFELASYHHLQLSPLSKISLVYKRGLDQGIEGNVFETVYTIQKKLSERINIEPAVKMTASSQYLDQLIFSQLALILPINYLLKPWFISLSGQYLWVPNYKKLFQDNQHDFVWNLKLGYQF